MQIEYNMLICCIPILSENAAKIYHVLQSENMSCKNTGLMFVCSLDYNESYFILSFKLKWTINENTANDS